MAIKQTAYGIGFYSRLNLGLFFCMLLVFGVAPVDLLLAEEGSVIDKSVLLRLTDGDEGKTVEFRVTVEPMDNGDIRLTEKEPKIGVAARTIIVRETDPMSQKITSALYSFAFEPTKAIRGFPNLKAGDVIPQQIVSAQDLILSGPVSGTEVSFRSPQIRIATQRSDDNGESSNRGIAKEPFDFDVIERQMIPLSENLNDSKGISVQRFLNGNQAYLVPLFDEHNVATGDFLLLVYATFKKGKQRLLHATRVDKDRDGNWRTQESYDIFSNLQRLRDTENLAQTLVERFKSLRMKLIDGGDLQPILGVNKHLKVRLRKPKPGRKEQELLDLEIKIRKKQIRTLRQASRVSVYPHVLVTANLNGNPWITSDPYPFGIEPIVFFRNGRYWVSHCISIEKSDWAEQILPPEANEFLDKITQRGASIEDKSGHFLMAHGAHILGLTNHMHFELEQSSGPKGGALVIDSVQVETATASTFLAPLFDKKKRPQVTGSEIRLTPFNVFNMQSVSSVHSSTGAIPPAHPATITSTVPAPNVGGSGDDVTRDAVVFLSPINKNVGWIQWSGGRGIVYVLYFNNENVEDLRTLQILGTPLVTIANANNPERGSGDHLTATATFAVGEQSIQLNGHYFVKGGYTVTISGVGNAINSLNILESMSNGLKSNQFAPTIPVDPNCALGLSGLRSTGKRRPR